jgi:hypothetical protein
VIVKLGELGLMSGLGLDLKRLELKDFLFEVLDLEFEMLSLGDEFLVLGFGLFDNFDNFLDLVVKPLDLAHEVDVLVFGFSQLFSEDLALLEGLSDELFDFLLLFEEDKLVFGLLLLNFEFGFL